MRLGDYLTERKISDADFATRIGVTGEAVRLWCLGHRTPRQAHLVAIMTATKGAVTANDFLPGNAHAGSKPGSARKGAHPL